MAQADFSYDGPRQDAEGARLSVSIYADRVPLREEWREDCAAAGLGIGDCAELGTLFGSELRVLGDIVLLDCPQVDSAAAAALSRLDMRAARSGAQLVVSTSVAALDDVFACLDQSGAQILVAPSRAERVVALGRILARVPSLRLRELGEDDRLMLLRLTEQVAGIAERLDRMRFAPDTPRGSVSEASAFRFESPGLAFRGETAEARLARAARPPLPDSSLVREIIHQRQLRARFFDGELFADPAWDMLLDLTAAKAEQKRVSVTSLCIASCVPPTTALRWIGQMTEAGLLTRVEDDSDRRRAFIALTDKAADGMAHYFHELSKVGAEVI